ncbi:hypothetical protein Cfor_01010 [Coptotermes formosanus]|uniref:Uncharacterized protein n=1 Tax=Coptotermes formosanus TaxID=36987 RepID=A0A6L2Q6L6_COPFO|nr:hypothetical protein Cfor_01010 [Coptotermes formosanus]
MEQSMNELMFGPHSERHSSHNIIRERGASEFFTFTEIKPGVAVIKLEPKGETELQPGGILDPGADGEIDPLALNTDRADPIVEQEDLPCPLAFLALESKAEDGMWDSATATVKVEIDGETREVHLEEYNGVGKMTWNGCMELKWKRGKPKKLVNMREEEKLAKRMEKNRLYKRQYQASDSQASFARGREQDMLYMRKIGGSLIDEDIESGSRKHKRKPVIAVTPHQLEWQKERNRIYMTKFCVSLSGDELEQCQEKERVLKRRAEKIMK